VPWTLLARPTVILAILLALSAAGNFILFKARDRALALVALKEAELNHARSAGKACSDATRQLREDAATRAREVARAINAAREAARDAGRRADATLTARPANPQDVCASALDLSRQKVQERRK